MKKNLDVDLVNMPCQPIQSMIVVLPDLRLEKTVKRQRHLKLIKLVATDIVRGALDAGLNFLIAVGTVVLAPITLPVWLWNDKRTWVQAELLWMNFAVGLPHRLAAAPGKIKARLVEGFRNYRESLERRLNDDSN